MKRARIILFLLLLGLTGYTQELKWIKFTWVGDSLGNRYLQKTAIDLPFQLENLPYKFDVQFDLGATCSMLYGNDILPYLAANKELKDKIDTSIKTWIDSKQYPTFKDLNIKLDNVSFDKINLGYYMGYGDSLAADSIKSSTVKHIGTIGSTFFRDKVLIIDYPNQRICVTDAIPEIYRKNGNFIDMKFTEGAILLSVLIGGKSENLMFDTGSSLFALSTNEKNADDVSGGNSAVSDSLKITAWGKEFYMYAKKATKEVKIGNATMPKTLVYYDKREWDYFFVRNNIWGVTGNAYFLSNTVIIDFKNQKFGVSNSL